MKTKGDVKGIAQRFRKLRQHLKLSSYDLGKLVGISHSGILEIEYGKRSPSPHLCATLSKSFNVNIDWLITGSGPMFKDQRYIEIPSEIEVKPGGEVDIGDIRFLSPPLHSVRAGAGFAGVIDNPQIEDIILFPKKLLPHVIPKNLFCVRVAGESMEPTIMDNDIVVIDSHWHYEDPTLLDGQLVAAIDKSGDLVVKRLKVVYEQEVGRPKRMAAKRIEALFGMSDNTGFLPSTLKDPRERNPIVGKVVLILRTKIV